MKASKILSYLGFLALSMGLAILPARAQTTAGSMEGGVTDTQGGAVPNGKVRLLNTATGLELNATTDETGRSIFRSCPWAPMR